jgi:hypothetical protein
MVGIVAAWSGKAHALDLQPKPTVASPRGSRAESPRIQAVAQADANSSDILSYVCKFIKAREAAKILEDLLERRQSPAIGTVAGGQRPVQPFAVAVEERTNAVLIRGASDRIALVKEVLKRIDVPVQDSLLVRTLPEFKSYRLAAGYAPVIARLLQEAYKAVPTVRISAVDDHLLLIYAESEEQVQIARQVVPLQADQTPPSQASPQRPGSAGGGGPQPGSGPGAQRGQVYDIYLKGGHMDEQAPSIAGVRLDGFESAAGKNWLRCLKANNPAEVFLIDSADILALRAVDAAQPARVSGPQRARGAPVPQVMFDNLTGGKDVWVRSEIDNEVRRQRFDRIAQDLGITNGRITRQQFVQHFENQILPGGGGAGGRGFGGITGPGGSGVGGFPGGAGQRRGFAVQGPGPLQDKLDAILKELRDLKSQLTDWEKTKEKGGPGSKR